MKISACLITKNEERCIERCLKSYKNSVDEIIVVDTGSTDSTTEIAKRLGAKVYSFTWQNDFALAKNAAIEKATGNWVIFIDADEYFDKDSAKQLRKFIENTADKNINIDAIHLRRYEILNSEPPTEYVSCLRAFRREENICYTGAIHEYVVKNGVPVNSLFAPVDKVILMHDGYMGALNKEKTERNAKILQELINSGNKDAYLNYYMAQTLAPTRDFVSIYKYLLAYLTQDKLQTNVAMAALIDAEKALCAMGRHTFENAFPGKNYEDDYSFLANNAIKRYPEHPSSYAISGNFCYFTNDITLCIKQYEQSLKLKELYHNDAEPSKNMLNNAYDVIVLRLAQCNRLMGNYMEAKKHCLTLLNINPDMPQVYAEYALSALKLNENVQTTALELLKYFKKCNNKHACLDAVWAVRCDLLFIILFNEYLKHSNDKGKFFTTMQIAIGEYQSAVYDLVEEISSHSYWQGEYLAWQEHLPPAEKEAFFAQIAECTAACLAKADGGLLKKLIPFCPPALQAAIMLCAGEQIEIFPKKGGEFLPIIEKRLLVLGAGNDILQLWQEVLKFYG